MARCCPPSREVMATGSIPPRLVAVGDGKPAVLAEGSRSDPDAWRRLTALVFRPVEHAHDTLDEGAIVAHRDDPLHLPVLLDVGLENGVEHVVRRERVGILLTRAEFR